MDRDFAIDPRLLNLGTTISSSKRPSRPDSPPEDDLLDCNNLTHDETPRIATSALTSAPLGGTSDLPINATPPLELPETRNTEFNDFDAMLRDCNTPEDDVALEGHAVGHLALWIAKNKSIEPSENQLKGLEAVTAVPVAKLSKWLVVHGISLLAHVIPVAPYQIMPRLIVEDDTYRVRCIASDFRYRPRNTDLSASKVFVCTNRCGQTFDRKGDWSRHEKVNFEEWLCPCCGKVFSRRDKLQDHVHDSHAGVRISKLHKRQFLAAKQRACGFCGSTLEQWAAWLAHVASHFEGGGAGGARHMSQWQEHRLLKETEELTRFSLTQSEYQNQVPRLSLGMSLARYVTVNGVGGEHVTVEEDIEDNGECTLPTETQSAPLSEDSFAVSRRKSQKPGIHKNKRRDPRRAKALDQQPEAHPIRPSTIGSDPNRSVLRSLRRSSSQSGTRLFIENTPLGSDRQVEKACLARSPYLPDSGTLLITEFGIVDDLLEPPGLTRFDRSKAKDDILARPATATDGSVTSPSRRPDLVTVRSPCLWAGSQHSDTGSMNHSMCDYEDSAGPESPSLSRFRRLITQPTNTYVAYDDRHLESDDDMDSLVDDLIGHRISQRKPTESSTEKQAKGREDGKKRQTTKPIIPKPWRK